MQIKLLRHGESKANTGEVHASQMGDAYIDLTSLGETQALGAGDILGADYLSNSLIYCSPYQRTRQTLQGVFKGAKVDDQGFKVYEDPRLREMEFGYNEKDAPLKIRARHGWFYFRHPGGESAADCYDRVSTFLESMMRQLERRPTKNILVVTHGAIIRCFVMRFLHLSVEEYESLINPGNCDIITIGKKEDLADPIFISGKWAVTGLKVRK